MNGNRLLAMARKEVIQIKRDARSIGIVIAMPLIMMLAFGYGVSFDTKHIPVYVFDQEGSQQSQDLLKRFQASAYFSLIGTVDNYPALIRDIDAGRCQIGIVIPADFSKKLNAGGNVSVQALVDGTDSNSANLGMSYSQAVVQAHSQQLQLEWFQHRGQTKVQPLVSVDARTWFNESLESMATIVPGGCCPCDGGNRYIPYLADRRARVGARHDGTAHLHTGNASGNHARQACPLCCNRFV